MAMPQKGSRVLNIDGQRYRWAVSVRDNTLNLVVEAADNAGPRLLAYFECRDLYVRKADGSWQFVSQRQSIRPSHLRRIVKAAIDQGWKPQQKGAGPYTLPNAPMVAQTIDARPIDSRRIDADAEEAYIKEIAQDFIETYMALSLCMDSAMYQRILAASADEPVSFGNHSMRKMGLTFSAYQDSFTEDGRLIVRLQCNEFPDIHEYFWWVCFA